MGNIKIGVIVGSLRKESFTRKIATSASALLTDKFEMNFIEIGNLPLYNQDFDDIGPVPVEYINFRKEIENCNGFLFVTPEYNRSFPAALKNALDVASRPAGQNPWNGKPAGVISVSPGRFGAILSNYHIIQPMSFLNIKLMASPETCISDVGSAFDTDGNITNKYIVSALENFSIAFEEWVNKIV